MDKRGILFISVFAYSILYGHGSSSWPIKFTYTPDNMPTIQIRLAPPSKPMPEVTAAISQLDMERTQFEKASMRELENAYSKILEEGKGKIRAMVDRVMEPCRSMLIVTGRSPSRSQQHNAYAGTPSSSFLQIHSVRSDKPGGEEMTAKISLLPVASPPEELEAKMNQIETVRSSHEGKIFLQAKSEMEALSSIVVNEAEAQLTLHINGILRLLQHSLARWSSARAANAIATNFVEVAKQPVLPAGLQLATNVRVLASEAPFPRLGSLVEDMERRRDVSETLLRRRILEMELQLLQSQNTILDDAIKTSVGMLMSLAPSA